MQIEYVLDSVMGLIMSYIEDNNKHDMRIIDYLPPSQLAEQMDLSIGSQGLENYEALVPLLEEYLRHSVKTGHPQFCNQLFAGLNFPAFLGEVLTALTNTSIFTYEVAPVATLMEKYLIEKMGKLVGFADADGVFSSGGSNSNLIAVQCARQWSMPQIKEAGHSGQPPLVVFVSDQAHYSFERAVITLGMGSENLIKVASDEHGRMRMDALEGAIVETRSSKKKAFMVVATTGTTILGAFDPIEQTAAIARKYGLWLHIDGAFGASTVLSPNQSHRMRGSHLADSLTWDAHKMMNIPLVSSVILVRHQGLIRKACGSDGGKYLFHDQGYDVEQYELGRKSLACSRRVDAMKLWMAWRYYGDEGYAKRIDQLFKLTDYAKERVLEHPQLELMAEPQSVNLCFRFLPRFKVDMDCFTLALRDDLVKSGGTLISYSNLANGIAFRMAFVNSDMQRRDFDYILERIVSHATKLEDAWGGLST